MFEFIFKNSDLIYGVDFAIYMTYSVTSVEFSRLVPSKESVSFPIGCLPFKVELETFFDQNSEFPVSVELSDGRILDVDFCVLAIGVHPQSELVANQLSLCPDRKQFFQKFLEVFYWPTVHLRLKTLKFRFHQIFYCL